MKIQFIFLLSLIISYVNYCKSININGCPNYQIIHFENGASIILCYENNNQIPNEFHNILENLNVTFNNNTNEITTTKPINTTPSPSITNTSNTTTNKHVNATPSPSITTTTEQVNTTPSSSITTTTEQVNTTPSSSITTTSSPTNTEQINTTPSPSITITSSPTTTTGQINTTPSTVTNDEINTTPSPSITTTSSPTNTEQINTTPSQSITTTSSPITTTEQINTTPSSVTNDEINTTPSPTTTNQVNTYPSPSITSTKKAAPSPNSFEINITTSTISPNEVSINFNISNSTKKNNLRHKGKKINSKLDGGEIASITISIILLLIIILIIIYKHKNRIFNKIKPIVYPQQIKVKIIKDKKLESEETNVKISKEKNIPKIRRKSYKVAPIKKLPPINNNRIKKIKRLSTFSGNKINKVPIPSIKRSNSVIVNSKSNNKKEKIDGLDNTLIQCSEYLLEDIERESKKLWGVNYQISKENNENLIEIKTKNIGNKKEDYEVVHISNNHDHKNIEQEPEPVLKIKTKLKNIINKEETKNKEILKLENIVNNMNNGLVARMKAKNELAQLKSKDNLPLKREKIKQEAALIKFIKKQVLPN